MGLLAFAQNTPETATVIDDLSTYEGTDAFVFNKADRSVYAYNNLGAYEKFGVYDKVYTLATEIADGEVDYIYSNSPDNGNRNAIIRTDYIPKTNTHIAATVLIEPKHVHDWCAVFGTGYYQEGWKNLFTFFDESTYGNGAIQSSDECVDIHGPVVWGRKVVYDLDAITGIGKNIDMDGNVLTYIESKKDAHRSWDIYDSYTDMTEFAPKAQDCLTPMYIFGMNKSVPGQVDEETGEPIEIIDCQAPFMKFFGMKVYEDETLVRDFVPYVQNGVAGVYDKVNEVFWPSSDTGDPLKVGVTPAYEGKLVRNMNDGHEYKYTGGAWVDCGEPSLEELANEDYKNMNTWKTNDGHMGIFFADGQTDTNIIYEDDCNYIDNYVGTGGFEPLMTKVAVEQGAEYNFSFEYLNAQGSWGWSRWSPRAVIWNGYDLGTSDAMAFTTSDVLANHILGHDRSLDYVPVTMDFTAAKDEQTVVVQFGYYEDGVSFMFEFDHLKIAKYIYPELYPEINPDDFAEVEPVRWDADGVGYAPIAGGEGNNANETWGKMLDNDATTKFCGSVNNAWVIIQAEKPVAVKQYSIVTGADTYTYDGRNPRAWTLEGSNDKKEWTIIDKVENYDLIEGINSEEFVFVPSYVEPTGEDTGAKESTSTEEFKFFRFTVKGARDGVQVGEFWINEQAHEWAAEPVEEVEPTCCKQGKKVAICEDCGVRKTEWIPETNIHDYEDGCYADEADMMLVFDSYAKDNPHHFKAVRVYHSELGLEGHDYNLELDAAAKEMYPGWTDIDYDDSDWDVLPLPMGDFGNFKTYWGAEDNGYLIRFPFTIENAADVEKLIFQTFHDDNYAAYLNGELIAKVINWNAGDIYKDGDRFANWDRVTSDGDNNFPNGTTVVYGNEEAIPLDLLQDGENVLAIYIQENWGGQYFDCRLGAIGISTGVKNVEVEKVGNDVVYDLQGRRMNSKNLPKGIYIVNGKKVVK